MGEADPDVLATAVFEQSESATLAESAPSGGAKDEAAEALGSGEVAAGETTLLAEGQSGADVVLAEVTGDEAGAEDVSNPPAGTDSADDPGAGGTEPVGTGEEIDTAALAELASTPPVPEGRAL